MENWSSLSTDVNNTLETLHHLTGALGKKWLNLNPILYTVWLENHALTFKSNAANYYFGEKSSFLQTFLKLSSKAESNEFRFRTFYGFFLLVFFSLFKLYLLMCGAVDLRSIIVQPVFVDV